MHSDHTVLSPNAKGMKKSNSDCGYADYGFYVGAKNHGEVKTEDFDYTICSKDYYTKVVHSTIPNDYVHTDEIRWSKWSNRSATEKIILNLNADSKIQSFYLTRERYPDSSNLEVRPSDRVIELQPMNFLWIGVKNSDYHRFEVRQGASKQDVSFSALPCKGYSQIL